MANPIGAATTGEVEDYKVTILGLDYGDAPDTGIGVAQGNYNTQASDSGPSHVIVSGLSLGSIAPDADPGTLQMSMPAPMTPTTSTTRMACRAPGVSVGPAQRAVTVQAVNATGSRHCRLLDRLQSRWRLRSQRASLTTFTTAPACSGSA